jgi:hypothetical protein
MVSVRESLPTTSATRALPQQMRWNQTISNHSAIRGNCFDANLRAFHADTPLSPPGSGVSTIGARTCAQAPSLLPDAKPRLSIHRFQSAGSVIAMSKVRPATRKREIVQRSLVEQKTDIRYASRVEELFSAITTKRGQIQCGVAARKRRFFVEGKPNTKITNTQQNTHTHNRDPHIAVVWCLF